MNITERHKALFEAQQASVPHLTVREMGRVLKLKSPSHVYGILDQMVEAGMAEKVPNGLKNIYIIKKGFAYRHREAHADE